MVLKDNLKQKSEGMKIFLEVFFTTMVGEDTIKYNVRRQDITCDKRDPDDVVRSIVSPTGDGCLELPYKGCFIHSTSWRYEHDGRIVITYLVFSDRLIFIDDTGATLMLKDVEAPRNIDPARPRPGKIREEQIVAHGIRHLGFLAKHHHRALNSVVCPDTLRYLREMEGLPAGKITECL